MSEFDLGVASGLSNTESAQSLKSSKSNGFEKIGFIILGQSTESGRAPVDEMTDFPQAFYSLKNPTINHGMEGQAVIEKIDSFSYGPQGGPWMKVYDELLDHGYELHMANVAIGSASWVNHAVGQVEAHATSTDTFRARRSPVHPSDPGISGTIIVEDGKAFELVTGTQTFTFLNNDGADIYVEGEKLPLELDYIYSPNAGKKTTASTKPDFSTPTAVGDIVVDGDCEWECISLDSASIGYYTGTQFKKQTRTFGGYDPLGMLRRCATYAKEMRTRGVSRIFVYVCNGQSDVGKSVTEYQTACTYILKDLRAQGFETILGLSTYAEGDLTTYWDDLSTAVAGTLTSLADDTGVHAGANLYQLMGTIDGENGLHYNTDRVHINAESSIVAGGHHADAVKAILSKLTS